jgi:hypothetical protein
MTVEQSNEIIAAHVWTAQDKRQLASETYANGDIDSAARYYAQAIEILSYLTDEEIQKGTALVNENRREMKQRRNWGGM